MDAAAELIDAAVDRWVWYAGWTDKIAGVLGAVHPVAGPYVGWSAPRPVGVVGAVSLPSLPALVEALAPVLAAGATAVVVAPHERPVGAAALAEVIATTELPAGAANVLTGPVGELATRLTGVDGLDLTGAPDDVAPDVVIAAAERGARVLAPPVIDDPPLARLRAWSEVTTVWHPGRPLISAGPLPTLPDVASDIVPIQLSLTEGDLVTLWAPRWREDGEDWEAFLGDDDSLFAFPEVAQLAAFVRTDDAHDLGDHPAWPVVADLTVAELTPEEAHRYDVIGVPELAAEDTDQWTVGELAEIVGMVRSIAEVCDLEIVEEVLDSAPGFALLDQGTLPFVGREGGKLWQQLVDTIAERWDDVIDALDDLVTTPRVDMTALAAAEKEADELAAREDADAAAAGDVGDDDGVDDREFDAVDDDEDDDRGRGRRRRDAAGRPVAAEVDA